MKQIRLNSLSMCAAITVTSCLLSFGVARAFGQDDASQFTLTSTTFENGQTLPLSTIYNNITNGVNACTPNGAAGGDESPELSWSNAPRGTQSFVVVLYDVTAAFTHWGMYNISPQRNGLPQNAGVVNSVYGSQIYNDFFVGPEYSGPCPPANVAPDAHKYVFTVYALSTTLTLPGSANFPAAPETLYHALIEAGRQGEILASAKLVSYYSSTPSN